MLGVEVSRFEGGHGAWTVGVTGAEHLVQYVKVDAVALEVVLDGRKAEIDEHHTSIIADHDVVRGQVAMRHRLSVKVTNRASDRAQQRLNVGNGCITKHLDEWAPLDVFQHQSVLIHVRIQQRWNGQT